LRPHSDHDVVRAAGEIVGAAGDVRIHTSVLCPTFNLRNRRTRCRSRVARTNPSSDASGLPESAKSNTGVAVPTAMHDRTVLGPLSSPSFIACAQVHLDVSAPARSPSSGRCRRLRPCTADGADVWPRAVSGGQRGGGQRSRGRRQKIAPRIPSTRLALRAAAPSPRIAGEGLGEGPVGHRYAFLSAYPYARLVRPRRACLRVAVLRPACRFRARLVAAL